MSFQFRHMIYPVRQRCEIAVVPVFPMTLSADAVYTMEIKVFSGLRRYGLRNRADAPNDADEAFFAERHTLILRDGALVMDVEFPQEDCYLCGLYIGEEKAADLELYALDDDLFGKTPFKGDNHMHTWMSDGRDSPMYMVAAACRFGYDYCTITDHGKRGPSLIARDFYQETGVDFLVIPGEEVHSPDNPVHIINLGGRASVNDWWRDHEDEYRAAVEDELSRMPEPMSAKDRYAAAASQVMFDRIRREGGASILCHPNWILPHGFNETEDITDYLFDHRRFDVLELIAGGAYEVGTQMQLSYYHDRPTMPIVGSSDAHSCFGYRLEPGNYTVVFADRLDADSVVDAIRSGRAVAGNGNKLYGEYRLVKYGYFLLRNYYPKHKELRSQLGTHMSRMASSGLNGDQQMIEKLQSPRPSELFEPLRWKAQN